MFPPASPQGPGEEILAEITRDLQDSARDLLRMLAASDGEEPLRRIAQMQDQLDGLTAAVVGRARYHRVTWAKISRILRVSEDTARHRYTERYILRRLARFTRPGSIPGSFTELFGTAPTTPPDHPTEQGGTPEAGTPARTDDPPADDITTISEPSGVAYNRLAPILSMLVRTSQLSNKEVSAKIGCSASYLSRILTGERVPTWELTRKFARACGADPDVLRTVWESQKLSQKGRDATVIDQAEDPMPATERLRTAVRTLHLRAGRPAPHDIAIASRWALDIASIASVLEAEALPEREVLLPLVRFLGGKVDYFEQLLEEAQEELLNGPGLLHRPRPAREPRGAANEEGDRRSRSPHLSESRETLAPAGLDGVLEAFSEAFTEQRTLESGRARLLQKLAEEPRAAAPGRNKRLQMLAERSRLMRGPAFSDTSPLARAALWGRTTTGRHAL
ncbi:helix-turn-helix domain-containing protein [Streptomyces lavendulocolor]|uniref:helix-turn-helix domain-containing protein n=1 Tax=Streptomyces lavendulocolor TaxID=67316 RepID=UPI0031D70F7F